MPKQELHVNAVANDHARLQRAFEPTETTAAESRSKLIEIGESLAACIDVQEKLENAKFEISKDKVGERTLYANAASHEYDRELVLRQLLSLEVATCAKSAAFQIFESISALELIWDQFPTESETFNAVQDYRRLKRMLFSVLHFLTSQGAEVPSYFQDQFGNPWVPVSEAAVRHRKIIEEIEANQAARMKIVREQ